MRTREKIRYTSRIAVKHQELQELADRISDPDLLLTAVQSLAVELQEYHDALRGEQE